MPLLTKTAIITEIGEGNHWMTWIRVHYPDGPYTDFGFDGRRLRSGSHGFYLNVVEGYEKGKKPEEYTRFSPSGLGVGTKVFCKVDTTVPEGLVTIVQPFPAPFLPKKK